MTTDELRGAPKPPNSVSLLFLTPHATALCYEGIILSNSQMRKLRHQEIKDLPVAEPARESTSSDTGARARSVPGAPEELPHGSLTIWQSEYCTERETEARGGASDSKVTVQAAVLLGQNPKQVCLQSSRPASTQDPKTQHSGAGPPSPAPRTIQLPARPNTEAVCIYHSLPIQPRACDSSRCYLPGGWPRTVPCL